MPFTLEINTLLTLQQNYLAGQTAELHLQNADNSYTLTESLRVSNPGTGITLQFTSTPVTAFRIVIRSGTGRLNWRSVKLRPADLNTRLRFSIVALDTTNTTFAADALEENITLPITRTIPNLTEIAIIDTVDVLPLSDHVAFFGSGEIKKPDNSFTLLGSSLGFTHRVFLNPSTSISNEKFVGINTKEFVMNMNNPVTGIAAGCFKEEVKKGIVDTLRTEINTAIRTELANRSSAIFGTDDELNDKISATVIEIKFVEAGTRRNTTGGRTLVQQLYAVQFLLEISIPSALMEQQTSSGRGCLGVTALLFTAASLALYFLLR